MAVIANGKIRLALVDAGGVKQKTLILPTPDKGTPELEWIEKVSTKELIDGSERTRLLGFLPQLTLTWKVYDDSQATGTGDGQTPTLEALLGILSGATGTLRVSPGPGPRTVPVVNRIFGTPDGSTATFTLLDPDGYPVTSVVGTPTIYRTDWQGRVQLFNTARKNWGLQSQDITSSPWLLNQAVRTANVGTAPDGTSTMNRLVENSATGVHAVYQAGPTLTAGDWVTVSAFVSQYSNGALGITIYGAAFPGGSSSVQFNPNTGQIEFAYNTTGCTYGVIALSGGVYRVWIRRQATASGSWSFEKALSRPGVSNITYNYAGDGASGVNLWGVQVEVNSPSTSSPTAYIPTTTSAASRTDFTFTSGGSVTFSPAPLASAVLDWSGTCVANDRNGGFTVDRVTVKPIHRSGPFYGGVTVTFRGRSIRSSRDLEVF